MDRDVAMQLKSKLTDINAVLQLIATGAAYTVENRNMRSVDMRYEEPEDVEPMTEDPEPVTKEKK